MLLVDDLTSRRIRDMRTRGTAPACVVETSPGNFQAWVSLGPDPMPKQERKVVARLLAEQFGGDMASADASHYGRLAGFTNRKESRLTSSGYTFVVCHEADGLDAERSLAIREWALAKCRASGVESTPRQVAASARPGRSRGRDPSAAF